MSKLEKQISEKNMEASRLKLQLNESNSRLESVVKENNAYFESINTKSKQQDTLESEHQVLKQQLEEAYSNLRLQRDTLTSLEKKLEESRR